jgi:hypothetical protein
MGVRTARCRCGEPIEWRLIDGRRIAYEAADGWVHDCPLARPPVECAKPGPKPVGTVHYVEAPIPEPDDEPAVINSRDYDQWVTLYAAELGCRESDLAYVVSYRAAIAALEHTNHTAA